MSTDQIDRLVRASAATALLAAAVWGSPAFAQTDYYNTDAGRPIRIEDAFPTERYAFELQLAPVRLERASGGIYSWALEPEIAYGILPRTHIEIGFPLAYTELGSDRRRSGLAGINISALYNLNVETRSLPAFGIVGQVLAPVGNLAPDKTYGSVKGMATRTYKWARFHVNAQYTFGQSPESATGDGSQDGNTPIGASAVEISRWLGGIAIDRTYPLSSRLITAEVYAQQPIHEEADVEWNVGAGIRQQLSPQFALDGGIGRRVTGEDRSWFATFGLAYAFGVRGLIPIPGR